MVQQAINLDDDILEIPDPETLAPGERNASLADLAVKWARLSEQEKAAEAEVKRLEQLRAAVESALFEEMTNADIAKMKIPGIGTISQRRDTYAKVADSDLAAAWLVANGYEELIKMQINASRLRTVVKERQEEGTELPEGVDFWIKESCTLRRS